MCVAGCVCIHRGSSRQCQRVALASTGVVVIQRLDLFRFVYPSDASEAGGREGACAHWATHFLTSYSLLSNAHVGRSSAYIPTLKKHNVSEARFSMLSKLLIQNYCGAILFPGLSFCHVLMVLSIDQMCASSSESWQISLYRWQKAIKNISKVDRPSGRLATWKSCWWGNGGSEKGLPSNFLIFPM